MKIAITVTKTEQISMDDYKDCYYTKTFEDTATISEINEWCQSVEKYMTIFNCKISQFVEPKELSLPELMDHFKNNNFQP